MTFFAGLLAQVARSHPYGPTSHYSHSEGHDREQDVKAVLPEVQIQRIAVSPVISAISALAIPLNAGLSNGFDRKSVCGTINRVSVHVRRTSTLSRPPPAAAVDLDRGMLLPTAVLIVARRQEEHSFRQFLARLAQPPVPRRPSPKTNPRRFPSTPRQTEVKELRIPPKNLASGAGKTFGEKQRMKNVVSLTDTFRKIAQLNLYR